LQTNVVRIGRASGARSSGSVKSLFLSSSAPSPPAVAVVAIGASAGGLQPLRTIMAGLPGDFPADVLVVLHVAATGTSVLPQILGRVCPLEVLRGEDGIELGHGRVIVAPPDHHLLVQDGHVVLGRGPRENGHRPAVDALMRSVATAYGPSAAGLVLSGTRDDGALGLAEIKHAGGVALVQDPEDAEYPSMPANAMAATAVDAALPVAAIPVLLTRLVRGEHALDAAADPAAQPLFPTGGSPLEIICPDCGGVLTEHDVAGLVHFRCHVGHAFSPRSLLALHAEGVERAMWTAARSLEDRGALLDRLADRAHAAGHAKIADQFTANAQRARSESAAIRSAIAALDDSFTADAPNGQEIHE
jgi:two-component system chemotaxis response regulator CheB